MYIENVEVQEMHFLMIITSKVSIPKLHSLTGVLVRFQKASKEE